MLQSNCRCVEIDLWGDCDVRHGNLSGKVKLSLVLEKIAATAFVTSSLPVFISVEQHCGMRGQENFAREVQATLGDHLVSGRGAYTVWQCAYILHAAESACVLSHTTCVSPFFMHVQSRMTVKG